MGNFNKNKFKATIENIYEDYIIIGFQYNDERQYCKIYKTDINFDYKLYDIIEIETECKINIKPFIENDFFINRENLIMEKLIKDLNFE